MAVGVTFAGVMTENSVISLAGALALSIGIAIQNFPEGAIISMPLQSHGLSKGKAFLYGAMSGIVEPIAAVITIFLTGIAVPLLPYLLSFAAGAMIYVVVEELIPESQAGEHSNIGTIFFGVGFILMMPVPTVVQNDSPFLPILSVIHLRCRRLFLMCCGAGRSRLGGCV